MWSSERLPRLALLAGLLLALAACGFRPLYGQEDDGYSTVGDLAEVRIVPLADRPGQEMHNALRNQINPRGQPADPRYELAVKLTVRRIDSSIRVDETATRATLRLQASFELLDAENGDKVFRGRALSLVSFNIVDTEFATYTAEENARRRGIRDLAEDIRLRLAAYFDRVRQTGLAS